MSDQHSITRTSPKGEAFVGTCMKCGKAGLTLKDIDQECDNPSRMKQDEALIAAIAGDEKGFPKLENCGTYLAKDNTGQWHYINHANTWQTCPPPFPDPVAVQAAGVADGNLITELVGSLKQLLAARKDTELMSAAIAAEAAIANAGGGACDRAI